MATRQITQYIDDLDGTDLGVDGRTVRFALDGRNYEIDLSPENAGKLEDALAPYITAGRTSSGGARQNAPRSKRGGNGLDLTAVREWARANAPLHNTDSSVLRRP